MSDSGAARLFDAAAWNLTVDPEVERRQLALWACVGSSLRPWNADVGMGRTGLGALHGQGGWN